MRRPVAVLYGRWMRLTVLAFCVAFVAPLLALAVLANVYVGVAVIALVVWGAVYLRPDDD